MPQSYTFTNKGNDMLLSGSEQQEGRFLFLTKDSHGEPWQKWYLDEANAIRTRSNLYPKKAGMSESDFCMAHSSEFYNLLL